MGEVMITCEKLRFTIAKGEGYLAREYRSVAALLAFTKTAYVEYAPLGVIGVIVPWSDACTPDARARSCHRVRKESRGAHSALLCSACCVLRNYPFHNVLSAAAAALMSGNGCVIKVSEYASWGAPWLEDMFRSILAKRGYDPELVQVITGMGETGNALVTCGVDKVLFIGSPAVGKLVMKAASATLTPVILELGGKDPFIVFSDAEFEHCVDIAIRGAFINCGQVRELRSAGLLRNKPPLAFLSLLRVCSLSLFVSVSRTASAPSVSTSKTPCTTSLSLRSPSASRRSSSESPI